MKALVYHGINKLAWEEKPRPTLKDARDAIIRISKTTICGTDLHILKGDLPEVSEGLTLGHEGVGVVVEVGTSVRRFRKGDRVLISCITSCGTCAACKKGMYSHCAEGGWVLGHSIDGTQAEYVRVPLADTSLYYIPERMTDEEPLVMLSDTLPTGYECGVLEGQVKAGDTVAIVGAGPVGLSALLTAQLYSPAEIIVVDLNHERLEVAGTLGATRVFSANALEEIQQFTGGKGVDVAIEAVGEPESFSLCESIVAVGGRIANIGVHGKSVDLHLDKLWSRNVTITTSLVDTVSTPLLMKMVESGKLQPIQLITHNFSLNDIVRAYDTFSEGAKRGGLKVMLNNLSPI